MKKLRRNQKAIIFICGPRIILKKCTDGGVADNRLVGLAYSGTCISRQPA